MPHFESDMDALHISSTEPWSVILNQAMKLNKYTSKVPKQAEA